MNPLARSAVGLIAGLVTVFLIDRLLWPGTLLPAAIGVVVAVIALAPIRWRRDGT